MRSKAHNRSQSDLAALTAFVLLSVSTGCLVENPAYQRFTVNDGSPPDAFGPLDSTSQSAADVAVVAKDTIMMSTQSLPPQVPTAGLIGWWSFDQLEGGVVRDLSGNNLDGNVVGELPLIAGPQGQAATFDGNTYVKVPYKPVLDEISGPVTISAWVWSKPSNFGDRHMLLSRQEGIGLWEHYGLACDDDAITMYLAPELSDHVHEPQVLSEWVHAAVTFDGNLMRLFINGAEQQAKAQSPRSISDTNGLTIGANQNEDMIGEFFEGDLDSLGLWKRALSADEIMLLATP